MNYKQILIIILLFVLTFVPRLYKLQNPIADWHSWRQADTAAVSRNFVKEGFNPLLPKNDIYNLLNENGKPNPNRYFLVEFPLYNILTYPFYHYFGVHEEYARLVSILASSLTAVFLYLLVRKYSSERVAVISGVFFAILPFSIYYGRVILPEPLNTFFSVLALYLVTLFLEREKYILLLLAALATSAAILTKPYALVLGLPIAYLFLRKWGLSVFKKPYMYIYLIIAFVPFILWRWHINQYSEGIPGAAWLFNYGGIRFTGAFFRWLIFDRMNRLIFATGGFVLFWMGIIRGRSKKEGWFYFSWLLAIVIYFIVIAKGNVTHDYYQIPLLPIGCIYMAHGFEFLAMYGKGIKQRIINFLVALSLTAMMLAFGWYEVRGFFNINHPEIVEAGKAVDTLLPKDAKVIAPYSDDAAFIYQTNRYGWTVGGGNITRFIQEGATHLVSVNFDSDTQEWMQKCSLVARTDKWVIIDLKHCQSSEQTIGLPGNLEPRM